MIEQASVVKPSDTKEKKALLPSYVLKKADGIYVNLSLFPVGGGFDKFIDRLFGDGFRFAGLDYKLLMDLLYDYDIVLDKFGLDAKVKLADDTVLFPDNRKALYRAVKLDDKFKFAEYIFEPVEVEEKFEAPVYGETDEDGIRPFIGTEIKSELKPTSLVTDEFVAEMWLKGIRFGIDVDKVAATIAQRGMVRMVFASQKDATEGSDAEIVEASDTLRRDNTPKILPNGKADLRKFQNRFPQISKGARLVRKKMRVHGKLGFKVNGNRLEPEPVKDVDLAKLAGAGTRVETHDGVEYIVSTRGGFLALDIDSNLIEVTESMESKVGVSAKTTGDLFLAGKDYIEHGEVQEGRTVEGVNMSFLSDVYGTVISTGGIILLEKNLSNGRAQNLGGEIRSNGRAFNSVIEVHDKRDQKTAGLITLNYAEACLIEAQSVVIQHAVNCEIIADNIEITTVEGCSIAGKRVQIDSSGASRRRETMIDMVLPDLSGFETKVRQIRKSIEACEQIILDKDREADQIKANPEVAKYLTLALNIKQSIVTLTEANQENWKKMVAKFAKVDNALAKLNTEKQEQIKRVQAFQQEIANLMEGREKMGSGISCKIAKVVGDTLVRTMSGCHGIAELQQMKSSDIKVKLRENGTEQERVFYNDQGSVDWVYKLREMAAGAS